MDFKDYYKVLGVEKTATAKEIKSAYRGLTRKFHPDLNPGDKDAEAKFAEINQAYEVLSDEEERKKFDEIADYVKAGGRPPGQGQRPPGGGQNFGGQQFSEEDLADLFGGGGGGSDFFEQFFGRRQSRATPRKGGDIHAEVEVTLEDAAQGSTRRLSLERQETCPTCGGTGAQGQSVCPGCRGAGQVIMPQTLEVKIPGGVTKGSTIRLANQGQAGGAGRGDLLLTIRLIPHSAYTVEGHDLRRDVDVSIFTAILGGPVEFEGMKGKLSLKLPPETQNGKVFRLKEQGLPRTGGRPSGDLYAKVSLRIPTGLTEAQREQFRKLQEGL